MFETIKNLFGKKESNTKDSDVEIKIEYRTQQDIFEELGISEEDFHSSVQDNLDILLNTKEFDKFYNTIDYLRNSDYNRDYELKLRIAEEVSNIIYKKHNELLKEATQFKKQQNLNEAVNTIKKAINDYPTENDRKSYFKLAYYYQLQKKWDDSWRVFQKVQDIYVGAVIHDPIEYQIINTELLQEMVKHLKREKKFSEYFYYLAEETYAELVMRSINGAREYVENFYANINNDFIDTSMMKNEKLQSEYLQAIRVFLESKKDNMFKLIKYTEKKTWQMMDVKTLKDLLKDLHYLGMSDCFNEHLSEKMSVLK